jgi:hypothetical protein
MALPASSTAAATGLSQRLRRSRFLSAPIRLPTARATRMAGGLSTHGRPRSLHGTSKRFRSPSSVKARLRMQGLLRLEWAGGAVSPGFQLSGRGCSRVRSASAPMTSVLQELVRTRTRTCSLGVECEAYLDHATVCRRTRPIPLFGCFGLGLLHSFIKLNCRRAEQRRFAPLKVNSS